MRRILLVCLANICRSPTAEGVLRHLLVQRAPELQVEVDSAGTADYHIGEPPDPRSQRAALRRGIDLSSLRARQVIEPDFARFEFILAMDRSNLLELQALQPKNSLARVQLFLEYAPQLELLEVPDPYYGDAGGFETVLDLSAAASLGLIAALQKVP
ncbi:MAG: low molecular weight protein-tyrosine-phosphatase [Gammaproteobacteria bacterium]